MAEEPKALRTAADRHGLGDAGGTAGRRRTISSIQDSFSVLLVEDDEDQRDLVAGWLKYAFPAVSVATAGSVRGAQIALESGSFDMVITDLGLPDSTHEETLPQLQAYLGPAPVIALTGHGEESTALRAMQTGAEDYLIKGSVNYELLRRAVMQARERHVLHRRMFEMATFDSLTGLWNREPFREEVSRAWDRAARHGDEFVLLLIDLDEFKEINDTHGHDAGDRLLQTVAGRLQNCTRRTDHVGRLGGDEFAVLLDRTSDDDLEIILSRMQASIREPVDLGDVSVRISASIGVARPNMQRDTLSDLFRHADAAMYQAKLHGRGRFRRFDSALHRQLRDERSTIRSLRDAVEKHEFVLHYQPIFGSREGQLESAEALVRWRHPVRGLLQPDQFIAELEKDDLVLEFGRRVMREVCLVTAARRRMGEPLAVAINLSPREFESPAFVERVEDVLVDTGASGLDLRLEITERMLIGDVKRARKTLMGLASLGVEVAIDDFGTGYSSLAYLRSLPVATLKVDRLFVSGEEGTTTDSAILNAIAQLAHALGYKVVAEGVETEAQLEEVRRVGCDAWQGFLGGRPVPLDDFMSWPRRHAGAVDVG